MGSSVRELGEGGELCSGKICVGLGRPREAARLGGEAGLEREILSCASVKEMAALRLPVWYGTVCGIRVLMTV